MKKFMKKMLSAITVAAMAFTMVVVPAIEAKAADTKELVVVLSDATDVTAVLLDCNQNHGDTGCPNFSTSATVTDKLSWGRDLYEFTQDATNSKVWKISVNGTIDVTADDWCNMQIVTVLSDGSQFGVKTYMANSETQNQLANAEVWNNNDNIYVSVNLSGTSWGDVAMSATDPLAVTAAECETAIAAIGTVTLTAESYAKIQNAKTKVSGYTGSTSDISNYATLTAAEETFNNLIAAGAGTITLHVDAPDSWSTVNVYSFGDAPMSKDTSANSWPGMAMTADDKNAGWVEATLTVTAATNLIFNNGSAQTENITYVGAGEYWYTVNDDNSYSVSTTAPSGWVEDASNEDASNEDTSNEDASNEDASNENTSNEDASNEDTSNEDSSNDNNAGNGNGGTGNGEGDVPAGIATPIAVISLVAIAAFAGAVICAKKKVTE